MRRLSSSGGGALPLRSAALRAFASPAGPESFPPGAAPRSAASFPAPPQPPTYGDSTASTPQTYREMLREYLKSLKLYTKANMAALQSTQGRVKGVRRAQDTLPEQVKRDSFWSFAPVAVMLWLYIRDLAERSYADFTHRQVKEYTLQHSKVKYEKI